MRPINLLPPEVAEERSRRRRIWLLVLAGIAYVLLLVAGVFFQQHRVAVANQKVVDQQRQNDGIRAQLAGLAAAEALRAEFEARSLLVQQALVNDVDWGTFLTDLAQQLPERVWMESFNGSIADGAAPEIVGQVTFSGVGLDYPDISEWLRALGSGAFDGVTGPWVSTASESSIGDESVVSFSSTATLTTGAMSDRVNDLIPTVVPEVP